MERLNIQAEMTETQSAKGRYVKYSNIQVRDKQILSGVNRAIKFVEDLKFDKVKQELKKLKAIVGTEPPEKSS